MANKEFKAGLYSVSGGGGSCDNTTPPLFSSKPYPSCPENCSFKHEYGCLSIDGVLLVEAGYILEGISILDNLRGVCEPGTAYVSYRLIDPKNEFPDETPRAKFAMGLTFLFNGIDFKICYDWIKEAADLGCSEAIEFLKHWKK